MAPRKGYSAAQLEQKRARYLENQTAHVAPVAPVVAAPPEESPAPVVESSHADVPVIEEVLETDLDAIPADERPEPGHGPVSPVEVIASLRPAQRKQVRLLLQRVPSESNWNELCSLLLEWNLDPDGDPMEFWEAVAPGTAARVSSLEEQLVVHEFSAEDEYLRYALPQPPPSYEEACHSLPHSLTEEAVITGGLGETLDDVREALQDLQWHRPSLEVFLRGLEGRWAAYRDFEALGKKVQSRFQFLTVENVFNPLAFRPEVMCERRIYNRNPYTGKFVPASLQQVTLSGKVAASLDAREKERREYTKLVMLIIADALPFFKSLNLQVFPMAACNASIDDLTKLYGAVITSKVKQGKLTVMGCRTYWRRLYGLLVAALENEELSPDLVLSYMDTTKIGGQLMGWTLSWGGKAFGNEYIAWLGDQPVIQDHEPGEVLGRAIGARKPPKQAGWFPDEFVMYLADLCHIGTVLQRARRVFYYYMSIGGARFHDALMVNELVTQPPHSVIVTARRTKTSLTGGYKQVTSFPLLDYQGRSLADAFECLKAQMGTYFCLADPVATASRRLDSPIRLDDDGHARPITYVHAMEFLRYLVEDYNQIRQRYNRPGHPEAPVIDPDIVTVHSPKGWLDTLAIQAEFSERATDMLCHWNQRKMSLLYNRNYSGVELGHRMQVVRLLRTNWRSQGPGKLVMPAPDLRNLPPVPNEVPAPSMDGNGTTWEY